MYLPAFQSLLLTQVHYSIHDVNSIHACGINITIVQYLYNLFGLIWPQSAKVVILAILLSLNVL